MPRPLQLLQSALVVLAATLALPVAAQFRKPEDAVGATDKACKSCHESDHQE